MRSSTVFGGLATAGGVVLLVRLSAWQWERGNTRGSLLNYTYAVEWMLLAVLLAVGVVVQHHGGSRSSDDQQSRDVDGRLIGPPLQPGQEVGDVTAVRVRRLVRGRLRPRSSPSTPRAAASRRRAGRRRA